MTAEVQITNSEWQMANETVANEQPAVSEAPQPTTLFAEAIIEPERWSELRFSVSGEIVEVLVESGAQVQVGEVIARLDSVYAEAAVREAEAALAMAQAHLVLAQTGPRAENIAAAESQVAAAEGNIARAVATRNQLSVSVRKAQLAAVQAQLDAIRAERRQLEANLRWAEDDGDDERAQDVREQIAVLDQRILAAQTRLEIIPRLFAAQVRAAESSVHVAEAHHTTSLAQLELAQARPRAAEIAIAQANVQKAQAALDAAHIALAHMELRAPFTGTVTQMFITRGDTVTPDRPIAILATLDRLQARTSDLLETDVVAIRPAQDVTLKVDALPEQVFLGKIVHLEAQSLLYRGDVTYPVIIELEGDTTALLWGMKALVEIAVQ
jgi:multidrug resistance efflux pump